MSTELDTLREQIRGTVVDRTTRRDEARIVRNAMIDKRPAVIVQAANAGDVMTAVRYGTDNGLTVAVAGRRAQRAWLRDRRRRRGRGPVADARWAGGPVGPHGPGRRRRDVG